MEKFQQLVLQLGERHPNASLTPPTAKTLVLNRLNQLCATYKSPDHPPYAAMIEKALRELNDVGGSSEGSILKFIEEEYGELPWGHSGLLKHHLGKLCEMGYILATRWDTYMLDEVNSSSESNRDGLVERTLKCRWDSESKRQIHQRDQLNLTDDKQRFPEIGVNGEVNQVEGYEAIMISQSCSDGKVDGVDGDPTLLPTRPLSMITSSGNKYPEAMTCQQETCPLRITNATMEEGEQGKRAPEFESVRVEDLSDSKVGWIYDCPLQEQDFFVDLPFDRLSNEAKPEMLILERSIDAELPEELGILPEPNKIMAIWDQYNTPESTTIWNHQELEHLGKHVVTETKHEGIEIYSRRGENGGPPKPEIPSEDVLMKFEQMEELSVEDLLRIITTSDTHDPSLTLIQSQSQQSITEEPRFLYRLIQEEILEKNQSATDPLDELHEQWHEEELDVAKDQISGDTLQLEHQPKLKPDFKASKSSPPSECQEITEVNQQRYFLEIPRPEKCERLQGRSTNFIEHQRDTEQPNRSADCWAHIEKLEVVNRTEDLLVHSGFVSISEQKFQLEEQQRRDRGARPKKRRRGRPSKAEMELVGVERVQSVEPNSPNPPKRGRGRPPKPYQETFRFNIDDFVY